MAKKLGADRVIYQSLDSLKKAVRMGNNKLTHFCGACFDGDYPTEDVTPEILKEIEREAIIEALKLTSGKKKDAARILGIGKTTLYEKIKHYGIKRLTEE